MSGKASRKLSLAAIAAAITAKSAVLLPAQTADAANLHDTIAAWFAYQAAKAQARQGDYGPLLDFIRAHPATSWARQELAELAARGVSVPDEIRAAVDAAVSAQREKAALGSPARASLY